MRSKLLARNPASVPTERMRALYHHFADDWGEPEDLIWFDPKLASVECALERIHVGVWPSDEECDVNSFVTFGMSEMEMGDTGSGSRVELQFAARGSYSRDEIHNAARFLANVAEYPFANNLTLDWWHSLGHAGKVPFFENVTKILFRPSFTGDACSYSGYGAETIKFLFIVPLTEDESHVITRHGPAAYEDYMEKNGFDPLGHK